jgi:two-component system, chemotaxis family, response regulator Rcp1
VKEYEILYAEDNRADVLLLKSALKISGFAPKLTIVENGVQTVEVLEERKRDKQPFPDLMLLDLNMPKMNGFEALQRLRQQEEFNAIPIIIYTGSGNPGDKAYCLSLKANDYWRKPQDLPQAIEIAERLKKLSS